MYTKYIEVSDMHTGKSEVESKLKILQTSTGKHVNYVSKGVYEVLDPLPVRVTSNAPDAF